ncbi:MAG: hypothetical protein EOL97_13800 [Spirochaetia bacterium]|nr:hypothetical protein [Spirochaetia bacterium]
MSKQVLTIEFVDGDESGNGRILHRYKVSEEDFDYFNNNIFYYIYEKDRYLKWVYKRFGKIEVMTPRTQFYDKIKDLDDDSYEFNQLCFIELLSNEIYGIRVDGMRIYEI